MNYRKFIHEPFEFPPIKQIYKNGKRFYDISGQHYPSVTTVLSTLNKDFLVAWRERVGEAEAEIITRRAASRGTDLHAICEDYVNNHENMPLRVASTMPDIVNLFKQVQPVLERIDKVYNVEASLYSHTLKTAGRSDLICQFDGINTVLDYKSSDKVKKEEWIENYFLQCATYAICAYEMKGIIIPQIAIVIGVEEINAPLVFVKRTSDYVQRVKEVFENYHKGL